MPESLPLPACRRSVMMERAACLFRKESILTNIGGSIAKINPIWVAKRMKIAKNQSPWPKFL
jgi:hypothetical protein